MADAPAATTTIGDLPHWEDDPDVYDALFLGGQQVPGVCKVKVERGRKIDKKSAKGKNKATLTLQGYEPADVTITVQVLDRADVKALIALLPMLEPAADKAKVSDKDALDIAHYAAGLRDVKSIIVEKVTGPEVVDGIMTLEIKACEYAPPPAGSGKGGVAGGAVSIGTFVDVHENVMPDSRVAYQGPQVMDAKGIPVLGEGSGYRIYNWSLAAVSSAASPEGFVKTSGGFQGRFIFPDDLLAAAWNKSRGIKDKDVTSTPNGSKGGPSLADFGGNDNDAPKPIDIDGEPDDGPSILTNNPGGGFFNF